MTDSTVGPGRLVRTALATAGLVGLAGCSDVTDVGDLGNRLTCPELAEARARADSLERDLEPDRAEWAEAFARRGQLPGGFADDELAAAEAVGMDVRESVVYLEESYAHATAWYVDDHHLVTNSHNVAEMASPTAWTLDGDSSDVEVVESVPSMSPDLALLRTDVAGPPLPLGSSESIEPGETVVQVGHPGNVGNWLLSVGRYVGAVHPVVDSFDDAVDYRELTTSVPGMEGNSGSPLVNMDGEVVGVTFGGEDQDLRTPGEAPEPADPVVRDWPLRSHTWSSHVAIEAVAELYEEWT